MGKRPVEYPSIEFLRECFDYDENTGQLRWKHRPRHHFHSAQSWATTNKKMAGTHAGTYDASGYMYVHLAGRRLAVHRIVWLIAKGDFDTDMLIDHKNGNKSDNRLENLRIASVSENGMNRTTLPTTNTSGVLGVTWNKKLEKWQAHVRVNGRKIHLGLYLSLNAAKEAAINGREMHHKEFSSYANPSFCPDDREKLNATTGVES